MLASLLDGLKIAPLKPQKRLFGFKVILLPIVNHRLVSDQVIPSACCTKHKRATGGLRKPVLVASIGRLLVIDALIVTQ